MTERKQSGSIVTLVMLGLAAAAILATIAYGSYYQIARGVQDTVLKANASALLTQAAYALATEATNIDADEILEPPAAATGWEVPLSSGAPKADAWGTPFRYCPWDNGSVNASAGRLDGENPGDQNSLQFALVSAGPDKNFDTVCAQPKTSPLGDDGVRSMTVAQVNQGVAGAHYYGAPVATQSALPLTDSPTGKLRIVLDTRVPYSWNGSAWVPLLTAVPVLVTATGASCSGYPVGTLASDSGDNLHLCSSSSLWKRVQ